MPKNKVEYNYYIDNHGLFYTCTIAGKLYEQFYINGVCQINEDIGINILYLCYIDEND